MVVLTRVAVVNNEVHIFSQTLRHVFQHGLVFFRNKQQFTCVPESPPATIQNISRLHTRMQITCRDMSFVFTYIHAKGRNIWICLYAHVFLRLQVK